MKQIGSIKDWIKTNPSAYIRHPKMQPGTCIHGFEFHKDGTISTYPTSYPDGPPSLPYFGNGCPYLDRDVVHYTAYAHYGMIGGSCVISSKFAEQELWEEVDPVACYEQSFA